MSETATIHMIIPTGYALVPKKLSTGMVDAWADASVGSVEGLSDEEANAACAQSDWDAMIGVAEKEMRKPHAIRRDLRPELSALFQAIEHNHDTGEGVQELQAAIDAAQIALAMDARAASLQYTANS